VKEEGEDVDKQRWRKDEEERRERGERQGWHIGRADGGDLDREGKRLR
jgi:hypothetical protein